MRRLVESCVLVACLVACSSGGSETITEVDGPFGGVYELREMNNAPLPLYFLVAWYPGRGSGPNVLSTTLLSAHLVVRPDGTFTWLTELEETASKPESAFPEYVVWKVRREADGLWSYDASTGAVSLQGIEAFGTYTLTGSATGTVLSLSSTFTGGSNSTFVLER